MDEIVVGPDAIIDVYWVGPEIDATLTIPRPNGLPALEFRPHRRAWTNIISPVHEPQRFKDFVVEFEGEETSVINLMRLFQENWAVMTWPDE